MRYICSESRATLSGCLTGLPEREQPDNIKSVNLIAETTQFLNLIYGSVNNKNIILITELFNTLVEFTSVCSLEVLHVVRLDVTQVT